MRNFYLTLIAVFFTCAVFANRTVFSLVVTATNETCSGNGSLTFFVQDAPAGATVLYSIYKLPDLDDDVSTQDGNTLGGLTAGTYRVFANVTVDGVTETQFEDAVIVSQIDNLAYNFWPSPPICGLTGSLTINVTQGIPATYEILSGPVILPPQSSNVLEGLVAGVYEIRVVDVCGEGWVQAYTLQEVATGIELVNQSNTVQDCDSISISLQIGPAPGTAAAYPMTVQITLYPPTGDPIVFNAVLTGPDDNSGVVTYQETLPFFEGEVFSYSVHITDNCGNELVLNNTITANSADPQVTAGMSGCDGHNILVGNVTEVIMTQAPGQYDGAIPGDFTAQILDNMVIIANVPPGEYIFIVKDLCGNEEELTVVVPDTGNGGSTPAASVIAGCAIGFGGLAVQGEIQTAILTSAPAGYSGPVPQDMTAQINPFNSVLAINNLPQGQYIFDVTNNCGAPFTVTANVPGYQSSTTANITELCGTFNLEFANQSNGMAATFWLQRYYPGLAMWGHPNNASGLYAEGSELNASNAFELENNFNNLNFSVMGQFRIIKMYLALANGSFSFIDCFETIYEFEFDNMPEITNVYSFSCTDGNFDVIVEAAGLPVLQYRITAKDGAPFIVNNGTSNIFTGLEPATYNFEVRDGCNNIVNRQFKIVAPLQFEITAGAFCIGETAVLSVPSFPFLNYQWYETANPSAILSNSATLEFAPFAATDAGNYSVVITSTNPDSCMNEVISYTVPAGIPQPVAGVANPLEICTSGTSIDLFTLLAAPFDTGGEWLSLTGGTLSDNMWDPSGLVPGTYFFSYTVTNPCGTLSVQTSATIFEAPSNISASVQGGICLGSAVTLTATGDANYQYTWTLPDGTSAQGQILQINDAQVSHSGIYTVTASVGECLGEPATASVLIEAVPQVLVSDACNGAVRWMTAQPVDSSFDPSAVQYSWTGPNGFTASGNPVNIATGSPGDYSVTVTTASGCLGSASAFIPNVKCMIPLGISPNNDGFNDSFDLEGFDVANLQVFNRYGVTVYERANYINQWYGQDFRDRILPAGAYYFLVRLAAGGYESGWVYVNREH